MAKCPLNKHTDEKIKVMASAQKTLERLYKADAALSTQIATRVREAYRPGISAKEIVATLEDEI